MANKLAGTLVIVSLFIVGGLFLVNCTPPPPTFIRAAEPGWKTIEIVEQYDYDTTWEKLVDALARRWDIEIMDKNSGYLRTGWIYTIGGITRNFYRGRVHVKFSMDRRRLDMKTEAQFLENGAWIPGYDTLLLEDAYSEILGKLGRTSR